MAHTLVVRVKVMAVIMVSRVGMWGVVLLMRVVVVRGQPPGGDGDGS
jgi:hypothetical protein